MNTMVDSLFEKAKMSSSKCIRSPRRTINFIVALAVELLFAVSSTALAKEIEYYRDPGSKAPFSTAVRAGDFLFVSGQIGKAVGPNPEEAFKAAAKDAMNHVSEVLLARGSRMDDVVQCTVMLADMKYWQTFNEVYLTYFKSDRLPARSAMGANGLANGAPVEVSCFAYVPR
jgi:2-iminobutanoate/2-iminopropanoate deaminase